MDLLQAMADQARRAVTTTEHGRTRVRFSRHRLLEAFRTDCYHAGLLRNKGLLKRADKLIETGRERTYWQLQKRHGFAAVAKKSHLIDRVLTRVEGRVRREVEL